MDKLVIIHVRGGKVVNAGDLTLTDKLRIANFRASSLDEIRTKIEMTTGAGAYGSENQVADV